MFVYRCVPINQNPIEPQLQTRWIKDMEYIRSCKWRTDKNCIAHSEWIERLEHELLNLDVNFGWGIWVFRTKPSEDQQRHLLNHYKHNLKGSEAKHLVGYKIEVPDHLLVATDGNDPYLKDRIELCNAWRENTYITKEDYVGKILSVDRCPDLDISIHLESTSNLLSRESFYTTQSE
jgi:hypothetical protein